MVKLISIFLLLFLTNCKKGSLHFPTNSYPLKSAENFILLNQHDEDFDFYLNTKEKKVILLFFGYSHCPDICISVLEKLSVVYSKLSDFEKNKVSMLFISIDPGRDNTALLKKYASRFDSNISLLTGNMETIKKIKSNFRVIAERNEKVSTQKRDGEYIHSTNLIWINSQKEILRMIPHQFHTNDLVEEIHFSLQ